MNRNAPCGIMLTGSYPPRVCGIADYTATLMRELHTLHLPMAVWTGVDQPIAAGVPMRTVHRTAEQWDGAGVRAIARQIIREQPALVHLQYEPGIYGHRAATCALPLYLRGRVPLVTTLHALNGPSGWGRWHRLALLPLLVGSAATTVCSHRQYAALQRLPFVRRKAHLVPVGSGVSLTGVRHQEAAGPLRLMYFGFVWRGRNIEWTLYALKAVRDAGIAATLDIVGAYDDNDYAKELQTMAGNLGIEPSVRLTGSLPAPAVSECLANSDIALLPYPTGASTGRTTLMATLEHGLPTVTTWLDSNLPPDFNNNVNMMLTPTNDTAAFAQSVVQVAQDVTLRERLREGAFCLAEGYTWPRIAAQFAALPPYQKLREGQP